MKGKRAKHRPILLMVMGLLFIIIAVVIWLASPEIGAAPGTTELPGEPSEVARVSVSEAKAAFDEGTAVFLDVRTNEEYAQSHIPGAVSIPLNELGARYTELDPSAWVITYCT